VAYKQIYQTSRYTILCSDDVANEKDPKVFFGIRIQPLFSS